MVNEIRHTVNEFLGYQMDGPNEILFVSFFLHSEEMKDLVSNGCMPLVTTRL